jgi:hypothetical protein
VAELGDRPGRCKEVLHGGAGWWTRRARASGGEWLHENVWAVTLAGLEPVAGCAGNFLGPDG